MHYRYSHPRAAVVAAAAIGLSMIAADTLAAPAYTITHIGPVTTATTSGQGISASGLWATGFSTPAGGGSLWDAFTRDTTGVASNLHADAAFPTARPFAFPAGVNDSGVAVGRQTTTAFFSSPLPVMWSGGVGTALPMPGTTNAGRANSINNSNVAVGSTQGGVGEPETATIFTTSSAQIISTQLNGGRLQTAFGINDAGKVVGNALDPNNAAATRPYIYDIGTDSVTDLGNLAGNNSGVAFAISSNSYVTGFSQLNQGAGVPFLWDAVNGMQPVPLPSGASTGSGRSVNADGWIVGTASTAFAVPFVYDGTNTYDLEPLITNLGAWDLNNNTSSAALGIGDNGNIVGVAMNGGVLSAYLLTPVPEPASIGAIAAIFGASVMRRRRA